MVLRASDGAEGFLFPLSLPTVYQLESFGWRTTARLWKKWMNGDAGRRTKGNYMLNESPLLTSSSLLTLYSSPAFSLSSWYVKQLQPHKIMKLHLIVPLLQTLGDCFTHWISTFHEGNRKQLQFFSLKELTLWLRRQKRRRKSNKRKWEEFAYCHLFWWAEDII